VPALFSLLHDIQSIRVADGGAAYSTITHRIKLAVNCSYVNNNICAKNLKRTLSTHRCTPLDTQAVPQPCPCFPLVRVTRKHHNNTHQTPKKLLAPVLVVLVISVLVVRSQCPTLFELSRVHVQPVAKRPDYVNNSLRISSFNRIYTTVHPEPKGGESPSSENL
jgi:hypothetical protein